MKLLFFIIFLAGIQAFGQITGVVKTAKTEPIPFANVVLYNSKDSTIIAGSSADELGKFSIKATRLGEVFLKISSIGYKNYSSKVFVVSNLSENFEIENVILTDENNALNEVTVSAKKQLVETTPTGKIINIQSSLMTKGSNALQVLERLPGVITDRRNNQFSLNGQSGVTILFNGRKVQMSMDELMNLLESTVADNIEKIELITSPTAKYDADGGAGIINIIFKNSEILGTKVNFSATAGYGFREKAVTSIGLSQGFKNLNFNASYSFSHDYRRSGYEGFGTAGSTFILGETSNTFYGFGRRNQNNHNVNLSADYQLNKLTNIGGEVIFSFDKSQNLVNNGGTYNLKSGEFIKMDALSSGQTDKQNAISSFFIKHKISQKSMLNLDYSFIKYSNDSPALISTAYSNEQDDPKVPQNPIFTTGNRGESLSKINVNVLKADFSTKLGTKIDAEFGAKYSKAENINDSKVERKEGENWVVDPRSQSNIYSEENLLAAYSQFQFLLNSKSNLHLGVRYEYWNRDINIYKDSFRIAQFFPSVLFTHKINENSNFSLNYSRRISRPAYADLVSNLFYTDPTFIFSGNPLLKPTLTDALKIDYSFKDFNIGLSFRYELDPILRYQITSNTSKDIGISSPQNLDYQKSINLFLGYPIQIANWWKLLLNTSTSLRNYRVSYSLKPTEKTFVFQSFNFSQNIQLPKNFEIELSGWYNLPFFEGTNKLKGFGVMNLGIGKKLKNDKGNLQIQMPDLLKSMSVHTHISGMTPIVFNINTVSNWRDETALYQVVKLTYSRSFGGSVKKAASSLEYEEKSRVGN